MPIGRVMADSLWLTVLPPRPPSSSRVTSVVVPGIFMYIPLPLRLQVNLPFCWLRNRPPPPPRVLPIARTVP